MLTCFIRNPIPYTARSLDEFCILVENLQTMGMGMSLKVNSTVKGLRGAVPNMFVLVP